MPDFLAACEEAARAGGRELLDWAGRFDVSEKGRSDLVTQADLASETVARTILLGHFPDHAFLGEENPKAFDPTARFCWVVDPLDGTTNYVHGVPHYAVSVALTDRGRPVVGVIYDPVNDECYRAEQGAGAFLNGRPITTSRVADLAGSLLVASFPAGVTEGHPEIGIFNAALLVCQGVRRTGSAALNLAYVAAGRFDGFWALSTKAWDIAAGTLLVEEAGGVVTNRAGQPLSIFDQPHPIASANRELHAKLLAVIQRGASGG